MKKIALIAVLIMVLTLLTVPVSALETNLISNGDFEDGNDGSFISNYTYKAEVAGVQNELYDPFVYAIGTDPNLYHSSWASFGDHTTGNGNMMIVNASNTDPSKVVWGSGDIELAEPELISDVSSSPLFAGQNMQVGEVFTKINGNQICVKFVLNEESIDEGWFITETHVAVADADEMAVIPQKNGNPIPGQFPEGETFDPGVTETEWYCIDIGDGWSAPYAVAAHAVIQKHECIVNATAPYGPSEVVDNTQGLRYDGTAVKAIRSNPTAALVFEGTKLETDFYSLGFGNDSTDYAFLTVRFDTPVLNGPGADLQIVEDTWGLPYPVESCDVFASLDGVDWTPLGSANNQTPLPDGVHTYTNFDFDLGPLSSASYVKVVDTSIRSDFAGLVSSQGATLDGFDVNAILSLQTNKTCTTYSETAWGGSDDFSGKNWAKYINYTPKYTPGPNTYEFSFWAANSYPTNLARLEVKINGEVINPVADLSEINPPTATWKQYKWTWNAWGATTANIEIRDQIGQYDGDDYALDDISFVKQ